MWKVYKRPKFFVVNDFLLSGLVSVSDMTNRELNEEKHTKGVEAKFNGLKWRLH